MSDQDDPTDAYDVVIVGGGAAGLNAALVLGRARRRVAVVDAGAPRNAPAAHMQGFLSRDGMPPTELLATGRVEVGGYGVELIEDNVVAIEAGFTVRLAGDRALDARRILIATGVRDVLPDIPGVRERWGRDLLHCPYCHGWEVRDQPLGVLGTRPDAVDHALLIRQWSEDVILFAHTLDLGADDLGRLDARGVRVVPWDRRPPARRGRPVDRRGTRRRSRDPACGRVHPADQRPTCRWPAGGARVRSRCRRLPRRRRGRADQLPGGLGSRERGRSPVPGDHVRRRWLSGGDRDQRGPGPGRRRSCGRARSGDIGTRPPT